MAARIRGVVVALDVIVQQPMEVSREWSMPDRERRAIVR
jgi:hypothetical protein